MQGRQKAAKNVMVKDFEGHKQLYRLMKTTAGLEHDLGIYACSIITLNLP